MVPDEVKPGAVVYLLAQNPGAAEEGCSRPLVGPTGLKWENTYLRAAGLTRAQVNVGNVIRCRWKGEDELPPISSVLVKQAITHCQAAHFRPPPETRLLIAMGDYACLALTGSTVSDGDKAGNGWRGYVKPYLPYQYDPSSPVRKSSQRGSSARTEPPGEAAYWLPGPTEPLPVLVTWHIARTFHQPWWILPTRTDWGKVPRILSGRWPIAPPAIARQPPQPWPSMFSFDTEFLYKWAYGTWPRGSRPPLIRYSMSWGLGDDETAVVEADQHRYPDIQGRPRVITQYSPADVWHLDALGAEQWPDLHEGETVWERFLIEDAVWKHSTLWSDHQHDLNYLSSLYSPFNRHKHLAGSAPRLYAGLDSLSLLYIDRALEAELDGDPASRRVWEEIDRPALGEFVRSQYKGIATNPDRVQEAIAQLQAEVDAAGQQARAIAGWPIQLSSNPQVAKRLYSAENIRPQR